MANTIDDAENLMTMVLIFGVIGVVIWVFHGSDDSGSPADKATNGTLKGVHKVVAGVIAGVKKFFGIGKDGTKGGVWITGTPGPGSEGPINYGGAGPLGSLDGSWQGDASILGDDLSQYGAQGAIDPAAVNGGFAASVFST